MKTKYLNPPQVIMLAFMGILLLAAMGIDMDMAGIISDALVKWAMNGVIVLSLIPMINVGEREGFQYNHGTIGRTCRHDFCPECPPDFVDRLFLLHIGGNGGRACIWPDLYGGFKQTEAERGDCGNLCGLFPLILFMNLFLYLCAC